MDKHIGEVGKITQYFDNNNSYRVNFENKSWIYPAELIEQHLMDEEKSTFNPIAMNCNQEQFDDVRRLLESNQCEIEDITNFKEHSYLVNNFTNQNKVIGNVFKCMSEDFNRKVFHKWDKKIFLNACGIEWEEEIDEETKQKLERFEKVLENGIANSKLNETCIDYGKIEHNPLDDLPIIGDGALMEVSNQGITWICKNVFAKYNNSFVAWTDHESTISIQLWEHARPITPKTKITRKEFEQKFEIID
jgi:hypothetical protein